MKTYWVCVAARWAVPPVACDGRGQGDAGAARHTEKAPHHPTLTTTRLELADAMAQPLDPNGARP